MRQCIKNTLEDLGEEDFETFKWFLQQPDHVNGLKGIPLSQLERAAVRTKTTDLIMEFYAGTEAQIMVDILTKMNKNALVLRFTNACKGMSSDAMPRGNTKGPSQHKQSFSTSTGPAVSAGDLSPEPQTRREFFQYARRLSLDLNTVHNWVSLSAGNRKVTYTDQEYQSYHADTQRFAVYTQALCSEGLFDERRYWEVEWSGQVVIAVSYNDIPRDGAEALFGANDKSWGLICSDLGFTLKHKKRETTVCGPRPSRVVGVYLDHCAGTLSFYSVTATMSLIHKVKTSFTQALHPGIGPCSVGSTGELCEIW